jgi:hypothetical protein
MYPQVHPLKHRATRVLPPRTKTVALASSTVSLIPLYLANKTHRLILSTEGKNNDEKSNDLKSSIENAWGKLIGADKSNNSDKVKSSKSDPNSKPDKKHESALDKAGKDDKPNKSNTKFEVSSKLSDTTSNSDSSTKSDKKPEDKNFIQKIENGWNSLTGNHKSSKSYSSNKSGDDLDAAFNTADKAVEKAAHKSNKKDKKDKKDD